MSMCIVSLKSQHERQKERDFVTVKHSLFTNNNLLQKKSGPITETYNIGRV